MSRFGLTRAALARAVGSTPQAVAKTPNAESLQPKLHSFEEVGILPSRPMPFVRLDVLGIYPDRIGLLVQLVVAQAGLNAASYWLLRDVMNADTRYQEARQVAYAHDHIPDRTQADDALRSTLAMVRARNPIGLVLNALGSALIVVALTRRRSRDFFDAAAAAIEER